MQNNPDRNDPGRRTPATGHVRFPVSEIDQSIPSRFECQVEIYPERTAVSDNGHAFSYKRLNEESNRVAHTILDAHGDSEEPVAFLLDQGSAAIIAILGILKAGKIYVALDPALPRPELAQIIADCQPACIVTNEKHQCLAGEIAPDGVHCLNTEAVSANTSISNPNVNLGSARMAYIFYTSGSTGAPKGVVDCHRNVLHNVMRYTNNLGIAIDDRLSLVQSCGFSGTVSSLFSALLNGATVCPFDLHSNGIERLADWVDREQITIFHSVPIIFEQLLKKKQRFESLRIIRLEGDQTHRRHVQMFRRHFKNDCLLVNGLGTTETGIIRQYCVDGNSPHCGGVVPVGYAVQDMQIQLLDETGSPVSQGAIGEICVESCYLATGYWGRAEMTARAFRAGSKIADSRSYATGDMGRLLPDGCLEYLGRKDLRIKLRGQSIETIQIENALNDLSVVNQATVVAHDKGDGHQQLVAYIVAESGPLPTVTALRQDLARTLPELMIPARFIYLDTLPIDRHNKVKRRHLPHPNRERPLLEQNFAAPTTPQQRAIADCFGEILHIDKVGLNDDFLELGGDSLMATELLLLIQRKLDLSFPIEFFFEERTVGALDRNVAINANYGMTVPLQPTGTRPPLFCLHNHAGHILEYRQLAKLLGPDQPVYGVRSVQVESGNDCRLGNMAARYVKEIQQVQPNGPYSLCGNCFGGLVAYEVAQQLRHKGEEVALLALIDTAYPAGTIMSLIRRSRIEKNWHELSQLPLRERLLSLGGKLAGFCRRLPGQIRQSLQSGVTKQSSGLQPGLRQQSLRAVEFHKKVEKCYRPRAYAGDMTLICIAVKENQRGWLRLAGRGLKIVRLTNQGQVISDPHLVEEPYVISLSNELRKLLNERV